MTWPMDENQFKTLIQLTADQRYRFCIQKMVETGELWSLNQGQLWAMGEDPAGRQFIPIWPHPELADRCRHKNWKDYNPRIIDLAAWKERWIPGIHDSKKFISVFPVPSGGAVMVSPERLRRDLEAQTNLGNQ